QKAIEIAREHAPAKDVSVEASLPNDLPRVLGDETALSEAFAHLVTNAAEAVLGQTNARLTLSAKPIRERNRDTGVMVTVRDNGQGMTPASNDQICSPFYP